MTAPLRRAAAALRPRWMGRNVAVAMAARVPMSACRTLGGVVVPIYLALIGFSAFELGELFLVAGLTSAVISSVSGTLSDRVGRRAFLVVMPALTAASAAVFALTQNPAAIFAATAVGTFGRSNGAGPGGVGPYQPVESALVAQSTPAVWRNAAFGRLWSASAFGSLIGGALALTAGGGRSSAAAVFTDYRPAFIVAAGLGAVASLLGLFIREPAGAQAGSAPGAASGAVRRMRFPRRSLPLLIRLWVANAANGAAMGMFGPFVAYWFFRRFGAGPGQLGVLFAVVNAATVMSGVVAPRVARRLGLMRAVVAGRALGAALMIPLALAPWYWLAAVVFLCWTGVQRVQVPLRQSFVLAAAHPDELASVAALSNLPAQVTMSAAPMATGYLFDEVSLELPFLLTGALLAVNAVLYWVFFRSITPEEERASPPVPAAPR